MNADLEKLIVLQAIDLELGKLKNELAGVPARRKAAETALRGAEDGLRQIEESMRKEEVLRRSQESDVRTHKDKLARLRKQLDAATSTAQVTALEHEISFAEQAITKLEDEELASMERTEQLEGDRSHGQEALERSTAALTRETAACEVLTERNTARVTVLNTERAAVRTEINATDDGERMLAQYDRVAKSKGTAISEATEHKCSACQMMLRPQRWNDLTSLDPNSPHKDEVFTCETCGRMLFYDPRRNTPGPWAPGERLAAAKVA
jgi:predicted  nucleic acid-binding Zn-ribbon protein